MKDSLQTSSVGGAGAPHPRSIWRERDVWLILPARAIAALGSSMTTVAVLLHLHAMIGEPLVIAAIMACTTVPLIALMGVAGHVADTRDSRHILLATTPVQVVAAATMALFPTAWVMFPAMTLIVLAQAFAFPTWQALLPEVVGEERISQSVSWLQGMITVAAPLGTAAGGIAIGLGDIRLAFAANAGTYAVLLIAVPLVRTRRRGGRKVGPDGLVRPTESEPAVSKSRWSTGMRILLSESVLGPLFVSLIVFVVLVEGVNPAEIFLARDELGASEVEYGLADLFTGAGAVIGAALAGRMVTDRRRMHTSLAGFAVAALAVLVAGTLSHFWVYVAVGAGLALAFSAGNVTFQSLVMTRTPAEHRGKVMAALVGMARSAGLAALALGGLVTTAVGPRWTFIGAGIAGMLVMAVTAWRLRGVIEQGAQVDCDPAEDPPGERPQVRGGRRCRPGVSDA